MAKDNNRDLEEIEREIAQTREQLGHTLEVLRYKVSPERLRAQTVDRFRPGGETGWMTSMRNHVRNNPLPYALLGAALAWRLLTGRQAQRGVSRQDVLSRIEAAYLRGLHDASRYSARRGRGGESGQRMAQALQFRARQLRHRWQDSSAMDSVGDGVSAVVGTAIGAGLQAIGTRSRRRHKADRTRHRRYPMATDRAAENLAESDVNQPEAQFGVASQPGQAVPPSGGLYDPIRPTDRG